MGDAVCIPPRPPSGSCTWTSTQLCLWSAPEWFTYRECLSAFAEYSSLFSLFKITLNIEDAASDDFLAYLNHIQDSKSHLTSKEEEQKIGLLYEKLHCDPKETETVKKIRYGPLSTRSC